MSSEPSPEAGVPTSADFFRLYGYSIMAFNRAEQAVKELLANLAAGAMNSIASPMALILTSEMGARGISQALRLIAHDVLEDEKGDRVNHTADLLDAISTYRNYYVHGINFVIGPDPDEPNINPVGHINHTSAKRAVVLYQDEVTMADLERFIEWSGSLERYATQLRFHLFFQIGSPPPMPGKPTLPKKLVKRQHGLKELLRQPKSSQG